MALIKEILKNAILAIATSRVIFSFLTYYFIKFSYAAKSNFVNKFIKSNPQPSLTDTPSQEYLYSYTEVQAEIGLKMLNAIFETDKKRITNASFFINNLSDKAKSKLPLILKNTKNTFWRLPIQTDEPDRFKKYLFRNYVDCVSTNLILAGDEPAFKKYARPTPRASLAHKAIFIPMHSSFDKKDMFYMAKLINNYFK